MASYSVAETRANLSALIDKALAGEEVVITRRGKATARIVPDQAARVQRDIRAATDRVQERLKGMPPLKIPTRNFREWLYEDEDY
jgi:prevent-host-death family protein